MTLATEGGSLWEGLEFGGALDPLESLLELDGCLQSCDGSLLMGHDPDVLSVDGSPAWLASDLAAGNLSKAMAVGQFAQLNNSASLVPAVQTEQPHLPAKGGNRLAAMPLSSSSSDPAAVESLIPAGREADGEHLLGDTPRRRLEHSSLHQPHYQQQQQQQQPLRKPLDPGQCQPKPRGRPRADRSQMTQKQLKAIKVTEAHLARKAWHATGGVVGALGCAVCNAVDLTRCQSWPHTLICDWAASHVELCSYIPVVHRNSLA